MKACMIYYRESGDPVIEETGNPSALLKTVKKMRKVEDFPAGVERIEIWTAARGCVKRHTKAKLLAYQKHHEDYQSSLKSADEEAGEDVTTETSEEVVGGASEFELTESAEDEEAGQ